MAQKGFPHSYGNQWYSKHTDLYVILADFLKSISHSFYYVYSGTKQYTEIQILFLAKQKEANRVSTDAELKW